MKKFLLIFFSLIFFILIPPSARAFSGTFEVTGGYIGAAYGAHVIGGSFSQDASIQCNIGDSQSRFYDASTSNPVGTSWDSCQFSTPGISVGVYSRDLPDGEYYVVLADFAGNTWTSQIFSIVNDQIIVSTPTPTPTPTPNPVTTTFNSSSDTYVKSGQDNRNSGAGEFMRIRADGDNRALVKFPQGEIEQAIGTGTILSAKVRLTIVDNGNNWGTGRTVDVHRLTSAWAEGNGTESNRGTGSGSTWNCATDSLIENQTKNCSGVTEWEMGQPNNPSVHPWTQTPTDTKTITNNQTGVVEYDVTSDVQEFMITTDNYGWILKKTNEGQNGLVSFGTRESSSIPQLVITYQP